MANTKRAHETDAFTAYLRKIGTYPLLKNNEELILSRTVRRVEQLKKQRVKGATLVEWAVAVELTEKELSRELQQGSFAKEKMVKHNLRLVVSIAKKYINRGMPIHDLVQEGAIGLSRSIDLFDPELGYKFSTYSSYWIKQAITKALNLTSRSIRLPVHIYEKINKIKKAYQAIARQKGKTATVTEIAEYLELPRDKVLALLLYSKRVKSLDAITENKDGEISSSVSAAHYTCSDQDLLIMRDELESYLYILNPRERRIFVLRYGLYGTDAQKYADIASELGICKERLRQLESAAMDKLREEVRANEEMVNTPLILGYKAKN
jgi:RNA polymerase nonessential primary-like sigma factor